MSSSCPLPSLIDLLHYRVLLNFDESSLGRLAQSCTFFREVAAEQALWRRLATCTDRLAAARYLGILSPEAGEVVSVESDPIRQRNCLDSESIVDWRDICRQLNANVAVRPWDVQENGRPASLAVWTELTDGWHSGNESLLPDAGLFGGQSPYMFWVGGSQLLALAGVYFAEMLGGVSARPFHDVYFIDILNDSEDLQQNNEEAEDEEVVSDDQMDLDEEMEDAEDEGPAVRRRLLERVQNMLHRHTSHAEPRPRRQDPCRVRALKLDCGDAGGALPHGHPSLNGSASDFDPIRKAAYFFGGGSPHGEVCNVTSALRLSGWEQLQQGQLPSSTPSARWEVVPTLGSVEAGHHPSGRQGLRGVVFNDEFIIFGGRERGGECHNDVWALDLPGVECSHYSSARCQWRELVCEGTPPSPRVWYGACHAVHGKWFIYGGSKWQFEEPTEPHDYRTLFVLDLALRSWSSIDPQPGPAGDMSPPWTVGASLVPLGTSQILVLGGAMPHKVGTEGIRISNLVHWRQWYSRLDEPYLFDLATMSWSHQLASVVPSGARPVVELQDHTAEVFLRAQLAATFVPTRRSVVAFGGSRYFTGEYFNDILELHLPASTSPTQNTSVLGKGCHPEVPKTPVGRFEHMDTLPKFLLRGNEQRLTRGLLGRLRGMLRERLLPQEEFDGILEDMLPEA